MKVIDGAIPPGYRQQKRNNMPNQKMCDGYSAFSVGLNRLITMYETAMEGATELEKIEVMMTGAAAMTNSVRLTLEKQMKEGQITQEQVDSIKDHINQMIEEGPQAFAAWHRSLAES